MRQTRSATGPLPEIGRHAALQSTKRPEVCERQRRRQLVSEQKRIWESSGQAFPLLLLPTEVRRMINCELFSFRNIKVSGLRLEISRVIGILLSCRQAHEEASYILYSENSFSLRNTDVNLLPGFLDRIGHGNRMAMNTISICGLRIEEDGWPNFCALASAIPLRSLDIRSVNSLTSLKSSVGATWVKDLARISSLELLSLSFSFSNTIIPGRVLQCQPAQEFLDYLQKELERTKGKVSHRERSRGSRQQRLDCASPCFVSIVETFAMESRSTPKFALKVEYYPTNRHEEANTSSEDNDAHDNGDR